MEHLLNFLPTYEYTDSAERTRSTYLTQNDITVLTIYPHCFI